MRNVNAERYAYDKGTMHYENMPIQIYWTFYNQKRKNFQMKNSDIFHISAQNIDCGYSLEPPRRGGSNEYPQSIFLRSNKKNNVYSCKPQFSYTKVGFKGVKTRYVFVMQICFLLKNKWTEFIPLGNSFSFKCRSLFSKGLSKCRKANGKS